MTVQDNTHAGFRAFFRDNVFGMPRVVYAPEDGNGSGGDAGDTSGGSDGTVDPKRDLDQPEKDLYPDLGKGDDEGDAADKDKDKKDGDDDDADDDADADADKDKKDGDGDDDDAEGDDDDDDDADKDKKDDKDVDLDKVPGKKDAYVLKAPDGMELDKTMVEKVTPMLKAKGYTHKEAQELMDVYVAVRKDEIQQREDDWADTVSNWGEETKKDKEIGGKHLNANLKAADGLIRKFGNDKARAALDNSGLGSHPEIIRMLAKAGKALVDDDVPNPSEGTNKASTLDDVADDLYGKTTPNKRGG